MTQGGHGVQYNPINAACAASVACATTFTYDANGNVLTRGAPKPNQNRCATKVTTTYVYDQLSRLKEKAYNDGTPRACYFYDESSVGIGSWTSPTLTNTKGRLSHTRTTTATSCSPTASPQTATVYSYNAAGGATKYWQCTPYNCSGSSKWEMTHSYNLASDVTSWIHPAGYTFTHDVNTAQRVTKLSSSLSDGTHPSTLADLTYAAHGAVATLLNGCAGTGCVRRQETYNYNNRLQPVMLRLGTARSQAANACLVYNYYSTTAPTSCAIPSQASSGNNGNVQSYFFQDNTSSPTPNVGHSATYTYDTLNRLANSTATGNQTHNLTFTNDRYGNPTCSGTGLCASLTYSTSTNRITAVGGVSVSYDAAGNMLTDATAPNWCSFTWVGENRLISVSGSATASYVYNALGQWVEKLVGTAYTEYAFDLQGEVVAHHNRTSWQRHIIPLGARPLARYQDSVTYFLHANHLGSTSFVTDHAGATIQKTIYYPYRQLWQSGGTIKDERFASLNERDAETTLDPTLFRRYHSRLYRWLTPDPLAGDVLNPQSLNRYAYVLNDPTDLTDPLGLQNECWPDTNCDPRTRHTGPPSNTGHYSMSPIRVPGYSELELRIVLGLVGGRPTPHCPPEFVTCLEFAQGVMGFDLGGNATYFFNAPDNLQLDAKEIFVIQLPAALPRVGPPQACQPSQSIQRLTYFESVALRVGCWAGPEVRPLGIQSRPQDVRDAPEVTPEEQSIYGPNKKGRMVPLNPKGANSPVPAATSGGLDYISRVFSCLLNVWSVARSQ